MGSRLCALPVLLSLLLVAGACRSVDRTLENLLRKGSYAEARALLEEEQVGETLSPDSDAATLALRSRFTESIEASTKELVDSLVRGGSAYEAHDVAGDRYGLCPWSDLLATILESSSERVSRIKSMESTWSDCLAANAVTVEQARQFLSEIASDRPWILDSDGLRRLEVLAARSAIDFWASLIAQREGRFTEGETLEMLADLSQCGIEEADLAELQDPLSILAQLPATLDIGFRIEHTCFEALTAARNLFTSNKQRDRGGRLAPCVDAAWISFERWHRTRFAQILESPDVRYSELGIAEDWDSIAPYGEAQRASLARAHARFAANRARQGITAALTLLHGRRARLLGLNSQDPSLVEAEAVAQATRATTPTPIFHLNVELEPRIEPEVHQLIEVCFIRGFQSHSDSLSALKLGSDDTGAADVTVRVQEATQVVDFDNVKLVSSSYFSHFETVPNPEKDLANNRLRSAEWEVDTKERAYKSAVSSHNIWLSEYSLNNVNWAYNAYARAVDHYNQLVSIYNATPSTTSRSVYLPYSFIEGDVSFGWRISCLVEVGVTQPPRTVPA